MFPLLRDKGDRYKHFSNPTHIPDNLFKALLPVLVIRHPILVLDSLCRAIKEENNAPAPAEEDFEAITTLKLSRDLFDGFCSQGRKPLVVDGDDVLWHTAEVTKAVCEYVGIDADSLSDTWTPFPGARTIDIKPLHLRMDESDMGIRRHRAARGEGTSISNIPSTHTLTRYISPTTPT